jgi:hypothetical protein
VLLSEAFACCGFFFFFPAVTAGAGAVETSVRVSAVKTFSLPSSRLT